MTAPPARLTRAERSAQTRRQLLRAAERVFRRDGFHGASIETIAAEAGFTKGAFYGNFADKEEAFLTLLETRFARRARAVERAARGQADSLDSARALGQVFARSLRRDSDWQRAFLEFVVHASRTPASTQRLAAVEAPLRQALCRGLAAFPDVVADRPVELVADAVWAAATGVALASTDPAVRRNAEPLLDLLLSAVLDRRSPT